MQVGGGGGGGKEDSNQSEQGSGLLLSCRLAYFNCGQAFTQTEDGLVCVYVDERGGGEGHITPPAILAHQSSLNAEVGEGAVNFL